MEKPEKSKIASALDEIIFGPFRKSADRRRPLLTYSVALVILVAGGFLMESFGFAGGVGYLMCICAWGFFCRWRKWA